MTESVAGSNEPASTEPPSSEPANPDPPAPAPVETPPPPAYPPAPTPPAYGAPQAGPAYGAAAQGLAMKKRNPFAVWIGLPLITLGIYVFVWYYKIHKEMAEFDPRRQIPVVGPMLVLLLLGWTVIGPLISFHNAGQRVRTAQQAAGLEPTCSPLLSWLLAFVFSLNTLYLQIELNKVVDRYGEAPAGTVVPLFA